MVAGSVISTNGVRRSEGYSVHLPVVPCNSPYPHTPQGAKSTQGALFRGRLQGTLAPSPAPLSSKIQHNTGFTWSSNDEILSIPDRVPNYSTGTWVLYGISNTRGISFQWIIRFPPQIEFLMVSR